MSDQDYTNKQHVTLKGSRYEATVTRYFDSMQEAYTWAESTTPVDTEELAASETSVDDAENINANVNPAPIPAGAEQVLSGGGDSNDGTTDGSTTPQEAAGELAVDNTAAGTHDPDLTTTTTQVPTVDSAPEASTQATK